MDALLSRVIPTSQEKHLPQVHEVVTPTGHWRFHGGRLGIWCLLDLITSWIFVLVGSCCSCWLPVRCMVPGLWMVTAKLSVTLVDRC